MTSTSLRCQCASVHAFLLGISPSTPALSMQCAGSAGQQQRRQQRAPDLHGAGEDRDRAPQQAADQQGQRLPRLPCWRRAGVTLKESMSPDSRAQEPRQHQVKTSGLLWPDSFISVKSESKGRGVAWAVAALGYINDGGWSIWRCRQRLHSCSHASHEPNGGNQIVLDPW